MKRILFLLTFFAALFVTTNIQGQVISWPMGNADIRDVSVPSSDSVDLTISNTLTYINSDTMTSSSVTYYASTVNTSKGALLHIEVTADTTNRTAKFGANLQSPDQTVTSNNTFIVSFINNGSKYMLTGFNQTD